MSTDKNQSPTAGSADSASRVSASYFLPSEGDGRIRANSAEDQSPTSGGPQCSIRNSRRARPISDVAFPQPLHTFFRQAIPMLFDGIQSLSLCSGDPTGGRGPSQTHLPCRLLSHAPPGLPTVQQHCCGPGFGELACLRARSVTHLYLCRPSSPRPRRWIRNRCGLARSG